MRSRVLLALVCALCLRAQSSSPVLHIQESIQLDGRLDEPFWQQAQAIELTQQSPKPGEPTPFNTTVRVVTNGENIYFGFECQDADPRQLAASPSTGR